MNSCFILNFSNGRTSTSQPVTHSNLSEFFMWKEKWYCIFPLTLTGSVSDLILTPYIYFSPATDKETDTDTNHRQMVFLDLSCLSHSARTQKPHGAVTDAMSVILPSCSHYPIEVLREYYQWIWGKTRNEVTGLMRKIATKSKEVNWFMKPK